jgi:hypothetical protein
MTASSDIDEFERTQTIDKGLLILMFLFVAVVGFGVTHFLHL